jgi:hypothetical protein
MKLVLVEESEPIDSRLLIGSQRCLDWNTDLELWDFLRIEKLFEELALLIFVLEEFLRERGWVRDSALEGHESDECCKGEGGEGSD